MSALWSAAEAARATGGDTTRDWTATGVSIDSRSLQAGDLFVALKDVRDGHEFVADALAAGAAAAMVSRRPDGVGADAPLLIVDDVLAALGRLGAAARERTAARVVAVTGSVGKTSTKEMLRVVLARQGATHAAERSFNNQWGVPLTLARMPVETDFAVIEIGMNQPGEIAPLARLARPDVAMITTIAPAHLEAFDGLAAIAREKLSIAEGLGAPGAALVVCGDVGDAVRAVLSEGWPDLRRVWFGSDAAFDWRIEDFQQKADCAVVMAQLGRHGRALFKLAAPGRHFALNAVGVLAVVDALGADPVVGAHDLAAWQPPEGRGRHQTIVLDIVHDDQTIELYDDAFNANPASMAAALEVLAATVPRDGVGRVARGRRIAILGDMLELGPSEERLHADIAALPAARQVDRFHTVGQRMAALRDALPEGQRGSHFDTAEAAARAAHGLVDAGDVVLVKGSKGSRVSLVVDAIRKLGHPQGRHESGETE